MNIQYRRRLAVADIRKLKRFHKLGQYSEVHKCACVYLKLKTNQLSKGALYHKMMQYSVGGCVIPCAFLGKSVKHTFS